MQLKVIKKRLGIESLIVFPIIIALVGAVFFLETMNEEATTAAMTNEALVNKVMSDKNALRTTYENVQKNIDLFTAAQSRNPMDGNFATKKIAEAKFNEFNSRFKLDKLKLSMSPQHDLADAKYKRKTVQVVANDLTLEFDTLTDEYTYNLLETMHKELQGVHRVNSLKMIRNERLSDQVLQALTNTGNSSLMKCEIHTSWLGIKPLADPNAPANPNAPR